MDEELGGVSYETDRSAFLGPGEAQTYLRIDRGGTLVLSVAVPVQRYRQVLGALMLTAPVRALALRVGMVDLPGPRKVHLQPIPLLGGLAMYGGVMLAILFAFDGAARAQSAGIVTGATLVAAVGFLDDRGWLHH